MSDRSLILDWASPSVPFLLALQGRDGSKREINFKLTFDFRAIALVEAVTGFSLLSAPGLIFNNISVSNLTILFWAAIQANHPEYVGQKGLDAVRSYFTFGNSDGMAEAVQESFLVSLPKEREEAIRADMAAKLAGGAVPLEKALPPSV